jgi:transposase InsO family protein
LTAENIALRQQLIVLNRNSSSPKLKERDRLFWVAISRIWSGWRDALLIVQPDTVVRWQKKGFKTYWRRKSERGKRGRPPLDPEIRDVVLKMANANPLWGAPKIHGELFKLGIVISERTVSGMLRRRKRKPPSQTWRTFIKNHMPDMDSMDFLVVPTIRFRLLYVLVILSHARRRVIHFNVTANPTAEWTAQQIIEAFPWDTAPRYLLRDRDSIYGDLFRQRIKSMGIQEVLTAYHSPWQNPYVERLHGSIRRECLDHIIIFNEDHLRRILRSYFAYYHEDRTHLGLAKDTPLERPVTNRVLPSDGIVALPRVGGLHHRYQWEEAA